jgi:adenine-specific DNA-methyltransferase
MAKKSGSKTPKQVEAFKHDEAHRRNIPTAEYESVMAKEAKTPIQVAIERRNRDLDPQLVWRGKDEKDASDLVIQAPPIYIQEKVHPKVLIDDLRRRSAESAKAAESQIDLFSDFNGIPKGADKTEFYQHDANWTNRMILGDSLQVMASLAEREGLRGKVQCIYIDPPYGIKFNSNFQWSTTSRDVKDGNVDHITREPEQVRAFRDTWRDGIHSYLSYLRDRLTIARELLTESGSIFVQIGDENVDKIKALLDEVFGASNFLSIIFVSKTSGFGDTRVLGSVGDFLLWYGKDAQETKYRQLYLEKSEDSELARDYKFTFDFIAGTGADDTTLDSGREFVRKATYSSTTSQGETQSGGFSVQHRGRDFACPAGQHWKTTREGMKRLVLASRIFQRTNSLRYVRLLDDYPVAPVANSWTDLRWGFDASDKRYVVETNPQIVARCILMSTDPGDLILDPTCGSGTTAAVSEQWGRRWITADTSRVALALARGRIMGARYPYYLLADSPEGQQKEGEVTRTPPKTTPTRGNLRHGFVYERVPHITLKSIANNTEIDVIWDRFREALEPLRQQLNQALGKTWEEWQIPRDPSTGSGAGLNWTNEAKLIHAEWWQARIARQKEIDASIAAKAETEYLYDKPYEDSKKVRVAGPFTVESLSPHRSLGVDENDELLDSVAETSPLHAEGQDFSTMVLENLKASGVQQAHKADKITFTSLAPWPGVYIAAEGTYEESGQRRRAAIFIGPEFGTVAREDLVKAAREAGDADFDVVVACAFNYEAHATEFDKLGRIRILKARMNADLHMAGDLKNTGKGNLFVIFGEPDIDILEVAGAPGEIQVKIKGVDVFHPQTGQVKSDGPEGIACWFIDTDYNEESFFVRHAYFLGANDPYKALKTTLKAEIDEDAWASLHSDTSRPFEKPKSGRIAVKVINHLGDEVMKVFRVE